MIPDPFEGLSEPEAKAVRRAAKVAREIHRHITTSNGRTWPHKKKTPERILRKVQRDWRHGAMLWARTLDLIRSQGWMQAAPMNKRGGPKQRAATTVDLNTAMPDEVMDRALERWIVTHGIGEPDGAPLFVAALERGMENADVEALASSQHMGRRALNRHLVGNGYPPPSVCLGWGAVLRAMDLYRRPDWTMRHVGIAMGGVSAFDLSNRMTRITGLRPREWKEAGADMDALVDAMVAVWRGEESCNYGSAA